MMRRRVAPPVATALWPSISVVQQSAPQSTTSSNSDKAFETLRQSAVAGQDNLPDVAPSQSTRFQNVAENEASMVSRVYRETLRPTDPFGGYGRSDYYRDPADGFAPRFAPRDWAQGGEVSHHHPVSSNYFHEQTQFHDMSDHDLERYTEHSAQVRSILGRVPPSEAQRMLSDEGQNLRDKYESDVRQSADPMPSVAFAERAIPRHVGAEVRSLYEEAPLVMGGARENAEAPGVGDVFSNLAADDFLEAERHKSNVREDTMNAEAFRELHGHRAFEHHMDTKEKQKERWGGYDVDASLAQRRRRDEEEPLITPLMAPSSAREAQNNLRQSATSSMHNIVSKTLEANAQGQAPRLGEALTEQVTTLMSVAADDKKRLRARQLVDEFGLGRQSTLVAEAGPDQRPQKLGKNDERLLNAAKFSPYKESTYAPNQLPEERNDTRTGVGHLTRTKFDADRRAETLAKASTTATDAHTVGDPLERNTIFYGQPIKESVDNFVRKRNNANGQRPIEYFMPHPDVKEMRLAAAYSDCEGFPLWKRTMEPFEWELFTRMRAHHQQRRQLALKHGLEPRPNETVAERDARRLKIDELCEMTPFDESMMSTKAHQLRPTVTMLRQWFGAYWFPSPTLVSNMLGKNYANIPLVDLERGDSGALDEREHILSQRYWNKLLTYDGMNSRLYRGYIKETVSKAPEPTIPLRQPPSVLKHFNPKQRKQYDEYLQLTMKAHTEKWTRILEGRRWIPGHEAYGTMTGSFELEVCDVKDQNTGRITTMTVTMFDEMCQKRINEAMSSNMAVTPDSIVLDAKDAEGMQMKSENRLIEGSKRKERFITVRMADSDEVIDMGEKEWNELEEEIRSDDVNQHINRQVAPYHYNRANYIETQDSVWEKRVVSGEEGWTPATHTDGLRVGLAVKARRTFIVYGENEDFQRQGELENAVIVNYHNQHFFNPDPRTITLRFASDGHVDEVPLSSVFIWQANRTGPNRAAPDESPFYAAATKRYVDYQDPKKKNAPKPHFLDKYLSADQLKAQHSFRTYRKVQDIDEFKSFDFQRSENHRLISSKDRKRYVVQGYFHKYTPWEFIIHQEADAPIISDQLRHDDIGPSYFAGPNRFWWTKRRGFGYLKNFTNETRDFFQYVDGVTPWEKARHIRTQWETREHHPTPAYMRPWAAHRNTGALLPTHLWEANKKTGRVQTLKDSLREYRPPDTEPRWAGL